MGSTVTDKVVPRRALNTADFEATSKPLARVLVPVGGSRADSAAMRLACDLARKSKARIYAIYVIAVKRSLPLDAELLPEAQRGEGVLSQMEQAAEEFDYEVETELLQAREVGPAIVDEACERNVDLIVMGIPYKRRFGEFTLGGTVPYVLKHAPCQVYVCRQPESATIAGS